ncbi:MAG: hypothetical protein ACD_47C00079G0007 [uncultured bacterium]|uniref:Uncharacterized protein n=1 Tax=Candidatus Wallbacteria bacterium GWC2_49_35 TaxID=1817813 RepID=A0A1F7WSN8_9BACT|nr:MAG: hypothetical protein ACD_47C00079G0007 [uncultured bacterium]OGM05657.1 MAG: hypothetical protein A2008_04435 [Candidatus Wallbacteria bacterium GWC2_49_35]
MSVLLNGSGREKKLLNHRAYTQGEIIAIFIVSSLIVLLSAVYWHQTSTEKQIAGVKDTVKAEAKKVMDSLIADMTKSKKGSMEVTPVGKTGAKVTFQYFDNNTLMPIFYLFERPKLTRRVRGKDTVVGVNVTGLKINEDFNTGAMDVEVATMISKDLVHPVTHTERGNCRMIEQIPEDVKILTEDGIELEAETSSGDEDVQSATLDYFTEYANASVVELKKRKMSLEFDIDGLKKREAEANSELTTLSPGIKNTSFPLVLPDVKDIYVLELAVKRPAIDQKYVETMHKKIQIITNQVKMKQELKVINSILTQKDKK